MLPSQHTEKHRSLLEKMIEDRIFSIGFYDGKFLISEECDQYLYAHKEKRRMNCQNYSNVVGETT